MELLSLTLALSLLSAEEIASPPILSVEAIRVDALDLTASLDFYRSQLGFSLTSGQRADGTLRLAKDGVPLILRQVESQGTAGPSMTLNLMTADLGGETERLRAAGATILGAEQQSAIGPFIRLEDPSGNPVHLMQLAWAEVDEPIKLFNLGLVTDDLEAAEEFYAGACGFGIHSRDYLPTTLPLAKRGVLPFVMHHSDTAQPLNPEGPRILLSFATANLETARLALEAKGVEFLDQQPAARADGSVLRFQDSAGYVHELIQGSEPQVLPSRLSSLDWMAGRWVQGAADSFLEETWSPPVGDSMVGCFRWQRSDETWLYELMTIEEDRGQIVFRLHHFARGMKIWEREKTDGPLTYPLLRVTQNEAIFEDLEKSPVRFVFRRIGERYEVRIEGPTGEADEFAYTRADS